MFPGIYLRIKVIIFFVKVKHYLQRQFNFFIPNMDAGNLLEYFLVAAVSALLFMRIFLKLTDYPQIGNDDLHIAHMLYGGFFMMIAIVILLAFLNKEAKKWAAIIGGFGFGLFIDELGKFVTSDNNYFFQPAIALIYVILVLIFLFMRFAERKVKLSSNDYAVNALELTKEVILYDLDSHERDRALYFLSKSDQKNPAVVALQKMLKSFKTKNKKKIGLFSKIKNFFYDKYIQIISHQRFYGSLIVFFIFYSVFNLLDAILKLKVIESLFDWGQIFSSVLANLFVAAGIVFLWKRNRLRSFLNFKLAVLVNIFLSQFFLFYHEQLAALLPLIINFVIYFTLQYLLEQEQLLLEKRDISVKQKFLSLIKSILPLAHKLHSRGKS
ncbi:MAG: hypothetical protein PVJ09_01865 [Candidatus Woesebacteria bacterium]|jgi:hypothetical protein